MDRIGSTRPFAGLLAVPLLLLAFAASAVAQDPGGYRVEAGDSLSITVYGEDDLSPDDLRVDSRGTISFPLLGEIRVAGMTDSEVEQKITRLLADGYLKHPQVSVSVSAYRQFYVRGEVKDPGGYSYQEGLTVQKAITLAGGLTERASKRKIDLEKESSPGRPIEGVSMNRSVDPGDIITVGESFF